ncbi:MAG TPA: helix-turn-helix transcriptional regulator [Thermoanaerobaculia bacterium]|nr:helix-turn-helix transcriptional regulator [Thermoanaerobaculia bacterium]
MAHTKGEGRAFRGLGKALRWIRQRQGKKQYEVAESAGITKAMLSSYENDKQRPALDTLERILDALAIDLDYLAHAIRMVRQEEDRKAGGRSEAPAPMAAPFSPGPYLDLERVLGLDRRLDAGEERAVAQMLDGFHNLLRYMLSRAARLAHPPGQLPPDPDEGHGEDAE